MRRHGERHLHEQLISIHEIHEKLWQLGSFFFCQLILYTQYFGSQLLSGRCLRPHPASFGEQIPRCRYSSSSDNADQAWRPSSLPRTPTAPHSTLHVKRCPPCASINDILLRGLSPFLRLRPLPTKGQPKVVIVVFISMS